MQTCVVHLIRHSLAFVSYKDRKAVAAALKQIYKAKDADAEKAAPEDFADGPWGRKYPAITKQESAFLLPAEEEMGLVGAVGGEPDERAALEVSRLIVDARAVADLFEKFVGQRI